MKKQNLQIALETGFGAGSMTIFADETVLDFLVNENSEKKAESLLEEILPILNKHSLDKTNISKIIYSINNGSQTGLKVGESIAKGIAVGLDIEIEGKDLLACLLKRFGNEDGSAATILPYGKNALESRYFKAYKFDVNPPTVKLMDKSPEDLLLDASENLKILTQLHIIQNDFENIYASINKKNLNTVDLGFNLSQYLF